MPDDQVHATYVLLLMGPRSVQSASINQETLREVEENLTDLLPPKFRVRIHPWDEREEETSE